MSLYPALLGGIIALLLGCVVILLVMESRVVRALCLALLVGTTFWLGTQYEKAEFVRRHTTLCVDKQAAYFRMFNGFDPFCPKVRF